MWLPAWLPAAHDAGRAALVLVTDIGPSTGEWTAPCPAQTPPSNPTAAGPGDGRVRSRPSWRVHEPCSSPEAVALRSQTGLTGSGSHRYSYGGFGGGHPHFHSHARPPVTRLPYEPTVLTDHDSSEVPLPPVTCGDGVEPSSQLRLIPRMSRAREMYRSGTRTVGPGSCPIRPVRRCDGSRTSRTDLVCRRYLPGDSPTRRPSTSSVVIVTNWSRTPGAHGTSGAAW